MRRVDAPSAARSESRNTEGLASPMARPGSRATSPPMGPGFASTSIVDRITVFPLLLRSVAEQRRVDSILLSEGQWDPDTQLFLSKERVLQERSRCISHMLQTLRVSPQSTYVETGRM